MSSPVTSIGNGSAEVSELISLLRSAFQPSDFNRVEQILAAREENLKGRIFQLEKDYDMMEKKHGEMALMKLETEDELNKVKGECDSLREENTRYKEDQSVQRDREKRAEARYKELSEKLAKAQSEVGKISLKNSELVSARDKAERDLESSRKRFDELSVRVLRLEKDTELLMNADRSSMQANTQNKVGDEPHVSMETKAVNRSQNEELVRTDGGAQPQVKESTCTSHDGETKAPLVSVYGPEAPLIRTETVSATGCGSHSPEFGNNSPQDAGMDACGPTEVGSGAVIDISDSDEEIPTTLKRKRDSYSSSSSSDDTASIQGALEEIRSEFRKKKKWEFEADMMQAFKSDRELCMNAVCALYRQQMRKMNDVSGSLLTNKHRLPPFDVIRVKSLGAYLTGGDPQGKLKKSAAEFQQHDPKGVDACRTLALRHSSQLFEIFQKEEDPFFLSF